MSVQQDPQQELQDGWGRAPYAAADGRGAARLQGLIEQRDCRPAPPNPTMPYHTHTQSHPIPPSLLRSLPQSPIIHESNLSVDLHKSKPQSPIPNPPRIKNPKPQTPLSPSPTLCISPLLLPTPSAISAPTVCISFLSHPGPFTPPPKKPQLYEQQTNRIFQETAIP